MLIEKSFCCCYCGELISFVLDLSSDCKNSVEDCEVCCGPIEFSYSVCENELVSFDVGRQD